MMGVVKRRAWKVLVLTLLCMHFFPLCFALDTEHPATFTADTAKTQSVSIAMDIVQGEQPGDYAVKPNGQYPRSSSPLTLKQIQHFLSIAISLILLVLIGSFAVYPTKLNRICIFVTSWHLLRAPPKTV